MSDLLWMVIGVQAMALYWLKRRCDYHDWWLKSVESRKADRPEWETTDEVEDDDGEGWKRA